MYVCVYGNMYTLNAWKYVCMHYVWCLFVCINILSIYLSIYGNMYVCIKYDSYIFVSIVFLFIYLSKYVCMYICTNKSYVCMYVCIYVPRVRIGGWVVALAWPHGHSIGSSLPKRKGYQSICMYACMYVCICVLM